jgi:multicomponent Na+:H+ antiporter subunit D
VAVGVALTVFAGPLFAFAERSATSLMDRSDYIEAVTGSAQDVPAHHGGSGSGSGSAGEGH